MPLIFATNARKPFEMSGHRLQFIQAKMKQTIICQREAVVPAYLISFEVARIQHCRTCNRIGPKFSDLVRFKKKPRLFVFKKIKSSANVITKSGILPAGMEFQAVVLADHDDGSGTRLYPLLESTPKSLLPVAGRPLIAYQLALLERSGFTEVRALSTQYGSDLTI